MPDFQKLTTEILKFRNERDWKQFHNPKDLAISLLLEAGEVLEHFQWKSSEEIEKHIIREKAEIGKELADVLYWVLLMSSDLNIDLNRMVKEKMKENRKKYPVEKSRGNHKKYNEL